MVTTTKPSNGETQTSEHSQKLNGHLVWLCEQLTILAEAFGESLTSARLKIYAADLAEFSREQLDQAFVWARREAVILPENS